VNVARHLSEDRVDLQLDAAFGEEQPATLEALVLHMAGLLGTSPDIVNPSKLRTDLVHRERRAPSLPGGGVALPHVRTLQARRLVLAVGISRAGLDLDAPDGLPVRLVIALVAPPYDDRGYLGAYKLLGERLQQPDWVDTVVASEVPGEVLRALGSA
jgi:mannitol/fructose-specific phosphotransferase system IIA component (Ntr-type)